MGEHSDVHKCDHDCDCFWCRVSRKEKFETVTDTQEVGTAETGGSE